MEQKLQNKFLDIISKHSNAKWAREELEWLVYSEYKNDYDKLSEDDKFMVDNYFAALIKIHGGN